MPRKKTEYKHRDHAEPFIGNYVFANDGQRMFLLQTRTERHAWVYKSPKAAAKDGWKRL